MTISKWVEELKGLAGEDCVVTEPSELEKYSYDWWPVARKWLKQEKRPYKADMVICPGNVEQISKVLRWASINHVPITPWGGGSSVTGSPLPTSGGIMLDMSKMDKILFLDETNLMVSVQAGKLGHELEKELNLKGYTLNHSPQSLDRSTPGGWVSTRATGQFSSRYGGIEELTIALTAVLPTGEIIETKLTPRAAIGPDLRHVFMGSEGIMGVVTSVTLKIFPIAEKRIFEAIRLPNVKSGLESMRIIMQKGIRPFLVRFYDEDESKFALKDSKFSGCAMFLGFEGDSRIASMEYEVALEVCRENGGQAIGSESVDQWMERRFDFSLIEGQLDLEGGVAETIEIAHFWDGIYETYLELKQALSECTEVVLGHFSHVYPQGTSLYIILLGKSESEERAEELLLKIWDIAMDICLEHGATISHHHGVGLVRAKKVRKDLASSAFLLDKIKSALDPARIMNPGKLGM